MVDIVQKLIALAKAEVGYHEGRSGGHWNNREKYAAEVPGMAWVSTTGSPWCDLWVHWLFHKGGVLNLLADVGPGAPGGSASCDVSRNAWRKAGRYSEFPAIGSQAFYGTPSDSNHTGFVVDFNDDDIWAVEGNTNNNGSVEGDGVYLKVRKRRSANVLGYGYPAYPGGVKSADPAWASGFKPGTDGGDHGIALRVDGTDLSHHNNVTAAGLKTAKDNGLRAVWHKATQGIDFIDPRYAGVRPWARAAGLRWGGYPFLEPVDIVQQIEFFLKHATPREGDLRPWLDFEDEPKKAVFAHWSAERRTEWLAKGVELLKKELGAYPFIYTSLDLVDDLNCMLVAPRYNNTNKPPSRADGTLAQPWPAPRIHQFADGTYGVPHTFPGLGAVDLDHFEMEGPKDSISWFLIPAQDDHKPPPPPPPPPPPRPAGPTSTKLHLLESRVKDHETSDHNPVFWKFQMDSGATYWRGHWNLQGTDPYGEVQALIREALEEASIWVFNEATTLPIQNYLHQLRRDGKINCFLPGVKLSTDGKSVVEAHPAAAVPIVWRRDTWHWVKTYSTRISDGAKGRSPHRYANRVLFEHVDTAERHRDLGTHWCQAIETGGNARKITLPGQIGRGKDDSAGTVNALQTDTAEVVDGMTYSEFGTGDLNVDFDADRRQVLAGKGTDWFPYTAIRKVAYMDGLNDHPPTHGGRLIDQGFLAPAK